MANTKKYFYYVCVFANDGPAYITSVEYGTKYAHWNKNEKPLSMSMTEADNLVFGLRCNFYNAVTVKTPIEIDYQPYNYDNFKIEFIRKEEIG